MVFLMKVALNFRSRETLFIFLQVSKICLSALCSLKVNPVFITESTVIWFYKHFSPDTIDFGFYGFTLMDLFTLPKQLRNVDFTEAFKKGLITIEFVQNIFPKVTRMSLLSLETEDNDYNACLECAKLITKHTKYLTSLNCLRVDLNFFIDFISDYTENGKEKYLHLPEIIIIFSDDGKPIEMNTTFFNKLKWLEQALPDNKRSTVYIKIKYHPEDKNVLSMFKKTTYIYDTCVSNMCETLSERVFCENGMIEIEGSTISPIINTIIKNSYSTSVEFKYSNEEMKTKWVVLESVSHLILLSKNNDVDGDNVDTRVLNIDFSFIKTFKIISFIEVKFDNEFLCLESLSVTNAVAIKFTEKCKMNNLSEIELWNVDETSFSCKLDKLKTLFVFKGYQITFKEKLDNLKRLTVIESDYVSLPEINFENKVVHLSHSAAITFNVIDSVEYLQKYADKKDTKKLVESANFVFEFPLPTKEENEWKMSKFVSMSPRVEVIGDEIIRNKGIEEDMYDMVVSYQFLDEINSYDKMQFINNNNVKETIQNVRYFEVEVTGNSLIAIGIMNVSKDTGYQNTMVGWQQRSCGYHSDDGSIYKEDINNVYDTNIRYGEKTGTCNVVGVGLVFNVLQTECDIFFTCNGKIVFQNKFDADSIAAVVSMNIFNKIVINYGEKQFKFDLNIMKEQLSNCVDDK
ncbi:hypothetical protein EIN_234080 [Entamoeba invadens IP1]|uniref:SPRY domain-containing protein n=1 Tax=Entamoeba invadens IP1 TaxID=370355 RepID=L7FK25_ENTIV|nr:hypothetical protein EIN_234080 [Entamoeba invadens IP1]ELP86001.1 hypothetical protein EIN_234080 [Entamoeba invadens IP1]|eukprot:XP_004185347.1 hypothetical protein EIN_234080 [Entamoeba invadens IP1]